MKGLSEKVRGLNDAIVATTMELGVIGFSGDYDLFLCNATPFLEAFPQFFISWQWLVQAIVTQKAVDTGSDEQGFYEAKLHTAEFYIHWKVPHALSTLETIRSQERTALDFEERWF